MDGKKFDVESLNRGRAAAIITRLKHGAQVCKLDKDAAGSDVISLQARYERKLKQQQLDQLEKAKAAREKQRAAIRDPVSVGPLPQPAQDTQ